FQTMAEFRGAMLDPETYLRGAPKLTTPPPVNVSMEGAAALDQGEGHPDSAPSTFRHGIGEMVDEGLSGAARSRKPPVIAVAGAAAGLGGGGGVFSAGRTQTPRAPPPPAAGPPPVQPPPIAAPATPKKVTVKFESRPSGATVVMRDTGKEMGTTPFEREFP